MFQFSRYSALLFFLIYFSFYSSAQDYQAVQEQRVLHIQKILSENLPDSTRAFHLSELSRNLVTINKLQDAIEAGLQSLVLSKKISYKKGEAASLASLGVTYKALNEIDKSIILLNNALKSSKESNYKLEEGYIYSHLGQVWWSKLDTLKALDYHYKALKINKELNILNRQAFAYDFIAQIYSQQGKYKEALENYNNAITLYSQINERFRLALAYGNAGLMHFWMNQIEESLENYLQASKNFELLKNRNGIIWIDGLKSNLYSRINDFDNALKYANHSLELNKLNNDNKGIADAFIYLGAIYFKMQNYDLASENYFNAIDIFKKENDEYGEMKALFFLSEIRFEQTKYDDALKYAGLSLNLASKHNKKRLISDCKRIIGAIYILLENPNQGRELILESFYLDSISSNSTNYPFQFLYLAKADSAQEKFKAALNNYKRFHFYQSNALKDNESAERVSLRYEFDKKEALVQSELKVKKMQRNIASIGIVLMILLLITVLYIFNLRRKKLESEKKIVDLERREILLVKETDRFKTKFLTNISHEFRTPLTLINGHLELLKKNATSSDLFRFQEMERNSRLLLQLINQLMDLSKLEFSEYKLVYKEGNMLQEAFSVVKSFISYADNLQITLDLEASKEAQEFFEKESMGFSKEALTIVINNLMSNALKFTPLHGKIKVKIDVKGSDIFILKVMNTGSEILPEFKEKIFERFYQIEGDSEKNLMGSGVGLSLVKELAELHGGQVTLESNGEYSTVFVVHFASQKSLIHILGTEFFEDKKTVEFTLDEPINDDKLVVLVVEDQPDLRRFIVESLRDNFTVLEANNGKIGMETALKMIPDIIISDIMMPELDGIEMCRNLKNNELTSHIPFMFLTAKAQQENIIEGLRSGSDDYLSKPFSIEELQLRVQNILRTRKLFQAKFSTAKGLQEIETNDELNSRDKSFLIKLSEFVEQHLDDKEFDVTKLAEMTFISVSQLTRKMKALIGVTPAEYIRNVRLNKAFSLLKSGESVSDASWSVGFEDPVYFSKVFKKHFGFPPSESKFK